MKFAVWMPVTSEWGEDAYTEAQLRAMTATPPNPPELRTLFGWRLATSRWMRWHRVGADEHIF